MQPQPNLPSTQQQQQPPTPPASTWERRASTTAPEGGASRWPWVAALLAVVALAGYFFWSRSQDSERQTKLASAGLRTFTVTAGGLIESTLLLTGQTGPEKYSSLLTPQLRGTRGAGRGGDGSNFSSRERGGRTSAASSSGGARASGGGSVVSSAGNAASGMSAGMRSSTSRVGGSSGSAARRAGGAAGSSSSMGADGLGSSAASLPGNGGGGGGAPGGGGGGGGAPGGGGGGGGRGGGGGGGGMAGGGSSEFMMVLQGAAPAGSRVKKGDMVAEFDRQYMLQRLDDFRASVAQSDASYKKLIAQIDVNKKAHEQTIANAVAAVDKAKLDMKTLPVLSSMDSERRRLTLEEAEARLKQLREEVRHVDIGLAADKRTADLELQQSKLELKRAEVNADRMIMKAPIDGLVVMQNTLRGTEFDQIKVGDQLMAGMMFMQIVEPGSMIINAMVNQADVQRLRLGQKAHVTFDAFPGLELPAHVSAIGSVARASRFRPDFVKDMAVVLKIDRMDPRVIPDLSVSCKVVLDSATVPVIVPREGVFQDAPDSKPYAFVRGVNGKWDRREVALTLASNTSVGVSSGLKAGDVIALDRPGTGTGDKPETVSANPAPSRAAFEAAPPARRRWFGIFG